MREQLDCRGVCPCKLSMRLGLGAILCILEEEWDAREFLQESTPDSMNMLDDVAISYVFGDSSITVHSLAEALHSQLAQLLQLRLGLDVGEVVGEVNLASATHGVLGRAPTLDDGSDLFF